MDTTTDEENGGNSSSPPAGGGVGKTYKCQLCSAQLMSMGELKSHLNKNHKGTDNCYPCTECSSIFKRRDHLGRHMMTQHQINSQRVSCPFKDCDTVMTRKDHLRRHISQVHKVDPSEYLPSSPKKRSSTTTNINMSSNDSSTTTNTTNPSSSSGGGGGDHNTKFKCVFTGCDAELSRKDHLCRHIKNVHKADPRDVIGHLYKTPRPEGGTSSTSTPTKSTSRSSRKRKGGDDAGTSAVSSRRKRGDMSSSIPSSSSGAGGGTLDLHLPHPPPGPPGSGSAHPSTLSDYDYGADFELDDFGDQQNDEEVDAQIIEEDDADAHDAIDAALCIFCCYSFYPEEDEEDDKLEESFEFNKFFSEVLFPPWGDGCGRGGDDYVNFFGGSDSIFSVCSDCWGMLIRAMGRKLEVEEVEMGRGVEGIGGKMKRLSRSLRKYVSEMERIEGVICGADVGRLKDIFLRGRGRGREGDIKGQIYKAMLLRENILEMTNELEKWREEMENKLIENLPVSPSNGHGGKNEKLVGQLANEELPTQLVYSLNEVDDSFEETVEEEIHSPQPSSSSFSKFVRERQFQPRHHRLQPPLPEEPDCEPQRYECPFEDCYIKLKGKIKFFRHINTVHSHEPQEILKEIKETLKVHGYIPLGPGETGTALQKKRYKQTLKTLKKLDSLEFEGVDIGQWSCFRRNILLDCRKRRLRCTELSASYSPDDIRDPRLECHLTYDPVTNLFLVGDIAIIVNEGQQILGCGKPGCNFWTSTAEPPPPDPGRPISTKKISWKSKEIESHIQLKHYIIYKCPFCSNSYGSFRSYVLHLNEHPNRKACNYCHKPYFGVNELRRHKWTRHMTREEIRDALERGEKDPRILPVGNDVHRCDTCGNSYQTRVALNLHWDEMHSENGKKGDWGCGECDKKFGTKGRLVYHEMFKCEGRGGEEGLRRGVEEMVGEDGRVECSLCGSRVKSWDRLKGHVKGVHSKEGVERGWECEICGRGFGLRGGLSRHMKWHSVERPWVCRKGECGATYKSSSQLRKHEKGCKGIRRGKCMPHKQVVGVVEGVRPEEGRRFDKIY